MHNIEDILASLKKLDVHERVRRAVRSRVFAEVYAPERAIPSPFYTRFSFASVGVFAALLLVVANQLPMQSTYVRSIAAVSDATRATEALEKGDAVAAITDVQEKTQRANEVLRTLKLKGQWGAYTQKQCLDAYALLDHHLDYLIDYAKQHADSATGDTQKALGDLRVFAEETRAEVQARIHMYPAEMR